MLRETAKVGRQEVYEWLAPRTGRVSGVTIREAIKYLAEDQREVLVAAYKEGRAVS